MKKSVTNNSIKHNLIENKNYTKVLEIIGLSPKPISSYEIIKEFTRLYPNIEGTTHNRKKDKSKWKKKHNQYIYKMIKNLRPNLVDNFYSYFFNWDEIIKDESQQKRVINYIKYEFKVDLRIAGNSFEEPDVLPVFSKSKDDKIIIIETQSKDIKVSIEKTRYNNVEIILNENNEKKIVSLKIKNDKEIYIPTISFGDPFDNFMNMIYRKRPFFLDIIYS